MSKIFIVANSTLISYVSKRVGMVFQQPNPFAMSIYDNVAYGPRTHGIRDKKQLDALVEKSCKRSSHLGRSQR